MNESVLSKKDINYLATTHKASGQVGKTIFKQLQALDFSALPAWGAKNYVTFDEGKDLEGNSHKGGLKFDVKGPKFKGRVLIYLMPDDLYNIGFGTLRGTKWKPEKEIKGIVWDRLIEVLSEKIG